MPNRLVLVDDHQMLRTGLRSFLEENSTWLVAGEASSAEEALLLFRDAGEVAEVAIVDISLPDMDGIALIRKLHASRPDISFIVYSMYVTAGYIDSALNAGARAYVSKSSPCDDVLSALDTVSRGDIYLDKVSLKMHFSQYDPAKTEKDKDVSGFREQLTLQENRVFLLAARNLTNAEIAGELRIRVKTVENYMSIIYQKLRVRNRFELLTYARDTGIS